INAVALDLGLASRGMLGNWIRSCKENGYNVVIKKKGRRTHEQEKAERIRAAQARKRQAVSPEFKAYCRKRISCIVKAIKLIAEQLTVNRLMRQMDLYGYVMKRRHSYGSYQGDIKGRIKSDLIKRKFFALSPNMKWYTDITEFNLKGKKLYLSPIIDCCGRDTVAYNISRHPNLKQVMSML
ncbi:IS3 family transposase, partial [Lactobacillus helveticus]|uniref:DDE-type integrase/transposase/recombinase n=1 Tax=Lactobacillus helveticus TaxID=1587 RepID=UPI0035CBF6C7|nr:IS3 family transposase [Lactobacillus helveticus]